MDLTNFEDLTIFYENPLFIAIAILIFIILILVICIMRLSSRIKRLSDAILSDKATKVLKKGDISKSSFQQMPSLNSKGEHSAHYGDKSSNIQAQVGNPRAMQPNQPTQAGGSLQPSRPMQPVRSVTQSSTVQYSGPIEAGGMPSNVSSTSSDFLEGYKLHENPDPNNGFGRPKPQIPFGEDRTGPNKVDIYGENAADSEFEPDSIDFRLVQGYKNFYESEE